MDSFLKIFVKKLIDSFVSLLVYLAGSIVLMLAGISLMSGKFPPPITEYIGKVRQAQESMNNLSVLQSTLQAQQQKNKIIDQALSESLEQSLADGEQKAAVRIAASEEEIKHIRALRIEVDFLKSQMHQAQIDLALVKKSCQLSANAK